MPHTFSISAVYSIYYDYSPKEVFFPTTYAKLIFPIFFCHRKISVT